MAYLSKLTANHILPTAPKVSQSIVEALMCILEKKRVSQSKVKCLCYENNFFLLSCLVCRSGKKKGDAPYTWLSPLSWRGSYRKTWLTVWKQLHKTVDVSNFFLAWLLGNLVKVGNIFGLNHSKIIPVLWARLAQVPVLINNTWKRNSVTGVWECHP